jgi:uncharacterized protein with HEPN domain
LIGESAWKVSAAFKAAHPGIPWERISGMRHLIVHDSLKVDWTVVFNTVKHRVPELVAVLKDLVPNEPESPET